MSHRSHGLIDIEDWPEWPENLHETIDQITRQASAVDLVHLRNRSVLQERLDLYQTSCEACRCPDFQRRRKPCKHIYALAAREGRIWLTEAVDADSLEDNLMRAIQDAVDAQPGWGAWDPLVHTRPPQQVLIRHAETRRRHTPWAFRPLPDGRHVTLTADGEEPCTVALEECTCERFRQRALPCWHIYLLALERGVLKHKTGT